MPNKLVTSEVQEYLAGRQDRMDALDAICKVAGVLYPYEDFTQFKDGTYAIEACKSDGTTEDIFFRPDPTFLYDVMEVAIA